ncbi:hypothetical protein Tco_0886649 [Tanacetum coccineum]
MEAHCIALELKYQNQALKSGQHGQILNETSDKAKMKKEIDAFETLNIELEHSVAKLLTVNEHLNKENETFKKYYKDQHDSIKITRAKTIEQTTSLITQNANLKAQIQENVFVITSLKNKLRKLKGNSVDTKFAKPSVLGKPVLQPLRNQSIVRQSNRFKSERPKSSKPRFASQVDEEKYLSKPVTQHYLPKGRESALAKPHHMIASNASRNSSKNMPKFSSNDMISNTLYVLHVKRCNALKQTDYACNNKIPERSEFSCKIQSHKTRNSNKPVDQKSHIQKSGRQIFTGHRFSPNKSSAVYEKISPRSDLRWNPIGRILKTVGRRWIPTGKSFDSCTSKADSESTHGSNVDISKIHECKQTLDLSAGTSINVQKKQSIDLSAGTSYNVNKENLRVWLLKKLISQKKVLKWIKN